MSLKIVVPFGGDSNERGISQASARSLQDHLATTDVTLKFLYYSPSWECYEIPVRLLYQNTPEDFDFRLVTREFSDLRVNDPAVIYADADLIFPAGHGVFFEDGQLQELAESLGTPLVGCGSAVCKKLFCKKSALEAMADEGLAKIETMSLTEIEDPKALVDQIRSFQEKHCQELVVKPADGGSSYGVLASDDELRILLHAAELLWAGASSVLIQPNLKKYLKGGGQEFTVIVTETIDGGPVALVPTEVGCDGIYDHRKKYLFSNASELRTPPEFGATDFESRKALTQEIRQWAEKLFADFGMRGVARIDGWRSDGDDQLYFSDFNPISGMGQSSFFFLQAAHAGLTHQEFLLHLINQAATREGLSVRANAIQTTGAAREEMFVLFGGTTNERETSIESGTNVWLKLSGSKKYRPSPWLLTKDENDAYVVWSLPYPYALYHSIEDITACCTNSDADEQLRREIRDEIRTRLGISSPEIKHECKCYTLEEFIQHAKSTGAYVFNAVHGGIGEDGTLQQILENHGVQRNGSPSAALKLCMDKSEATKFIADLGIEGIYSSANGLSADHIVENWNDLQSATAEEFWFKLQQQFPQLEADGVMVKPASDGCSTGVVRLRNPLELEVYFNALRQRQPYIVANQLSSHQDDIEMPRETPKKLMFEEFVVTAGVSVVNKTKLKWPEEPKWVEVTVGIVGQRGQMQALQPSVTVKADGGVLTREDKFTMGAGVNLTPPPERHVQTQIVDRVRNLTEQVANHLGLNGFGRIDLFINCDSGDIYFIEANTVPGMTPATVLFHQGLQMDPPRLPAELLEEIAGY